jgi:HIV Tat-specific factor 1
MHGRFFSGTQVDATIATGRERYQKSSARKADADVDDEVEGGDKDTEESKRLDKFGQWLEENEQEASVGAAK